MKFFTNHSGILSALILGVAIISSAFLLTRDNPATFAERAVASPSSALRQQVIEKDSDGDGLPDWEEALWGTDPFVVDTDGDGILDGEFVASRKRNKAPEEIINFEDLNFTSQFSRTFFGEYLTYQSDGELSESEKEILISRLVSSASIVLPEKFPSGKVHVTTNTDEALRLYFVQIAFTAQNTTPRDVSDNELVLLEKGLKEHDKTSFEDMKKIADGYTNLSLGLAELEVPSTLRNAHAELVTATNRLGFIINGLTSVTTDAVYALGIFPEYEVEANRMISALRTINESVRASEIVKDTNVQNAQKALGL